MAALVHSFYAWRIKIVTDSWPLVVAIAVCTICQFCASEWLDIRDYD